MSTFAVTREIVGEVRPAENSDWLDLVRLEAKDYDFITQRGLYEVGDVVVYFPVDSLLPMWIVEAMGLEGKLAHGPIPDDGSERLRNRVKTVKLRGNLSQGVVCTPEVLLEANAYLDEKALKEDDLTGVLGVSKYEPPVIPSKHGNLVPLPEGISVYDIEGAQNYPDIIEEMMTTPVCITEKIEGSNWWASLDSDRFVTVGQRNYAIERSQDGIHDWWKAFESQSLGRLLRDLYDELLVVEGQSSIQRLTIRGEIVGPGIQGNYYGLPDHKVFIFDIERNGIPVDAKEFLRLADKYKFATVPLIAVDMLLSDWLGNLNVKESSDGKSLLADRPREGIVIKPMIEHTHSKIGRLFIKQRGPEYLAKSDH